MLATVDALEIPADNLVLNRTSLKESREENRRIQCDESKSDFIDNVIRILHFFVMYI